MESSFGTSSDARKKRVYYTESSTIYEGMPVCYEFDATANVLDYDKGAGGDRTCQTTPGTTAEGNQNEGKFMRVEDPDANNIQYFAGVVAGSSYAGLVGPRWLDIYIPNGAIVPVRTDLNCLIGQTILAVTTASQELGVPLATDSRAVAVAEETVDRGTAGLVLARLTLDQFMYQDHGGTALSVDDADTTTSTLVNFANIKFLGSSSYQRVLSMVGNIAGGGAALFGMFKFRTYVSSTPGSLVQVLCANLHIQSGGTLIFGSGEYNSAVYATIETESATPDLTNVNICAYQAALYLTESGGAPANVHVLGIPNGTPTNFDGLFRAQSAAAVGGATVSTADITSQDSASDINIPVKFGN
ncbi:hypothetical protein LCGC14_2981820, partial [marine sediment metagenome]